MKLLNRTRQLYKKILQTHAKSETALLQSVENARHLQNLTKHPGWKMVEDFMATQKEGTHAFMEQETSKSLSIIGIVFVFNTFVKWLFASAEYRAYNKVKTYIKVTIENGEKSKQKLAKLHQSEEAK